MIPRHLVASPVVDPTSPLFEEAGSLWSYLKQLVLRSRDVEGKHFFGL